MINDKNEFQEDAYRLLVAHISQHALLQGGGSASDPEGYLPLVGGGGSASGPGLGGVHPSMHWSRPHCGQNDRHL